MYLELNYYETHALDLPIVPRDMKAMGASAATWLVWLSQGAASSHSCHEQHNFFYYEKHVGRHLSWRRVVWTAGVERRNHILTPISDEIPTHVSKLDRELTSAER